MEGQEFAQATDQFYNALAEGDLSTATLALFTIEDIVGKQTTKDGVGKATAPSVTYREVRNDNGIENTINLQTLCSCGV